MAELSWLPLWSRVHPEPLYRLSLVEPIFSAPVLWCAAQTEVAFFGGSFVPGYSQCGPAWRDQHWTRTRRPRFGFQGSQSRATFAHTQPSPAGTGPSAQRGGGGIIRGAGAELGSTCPISPRCLWTWGTVEPGQPDIPNSQILVLIIN